jgi:hypothetical protein
MGSKAYLMTALLFQVTAAQPPGGGLGELLLGLGVVLGAFALLALFWLLLKAFRSDDGW